MKPAKFSDFLQFEEEAPIQDFVWADFLFELGCRVAMAEPAKVKILLVLPVIDIAAPLVALGYLYGKFNGIQAGRISIDSFRHLPSGSSLLYNTPTGPVQAVYEGMSKFNDMDCIRVRVQSNEKGGGAQLVLPQHLNRILLLPNAAKPSSERSLGKNIAGVSDFAKHIYGENNMENIAPILNCTWLIGRFNELSDELNNISLGAKQPGTAGNFTDLIRADKFLRAGEPSFACVESCYRQDSDFSIPPSTAKLTIFREGVSYLKHQHHYKNASKIVLMDFADRNCEYIIEAYNEEYLQRGEDWRFEFDHMPDNLICAGYIEAGHA